MILVRQIFQAKWGKGGELAAGMKAGVGAMAGPMGNPRIMILTDLSGEFNRVILEGVHESLSAWEEFRARLFTSPEFQASNAASEGLIVSGSQEYYTIEVDL